jgi:integrase
MALRRERAAISESKLSANTREAYHFDWADFLRWCDAAGRAPLPASSDTVQLYAVSQAGAGKLPSTIGRRMAAIAHRHLAAGFPSPIDADVREVLAGIGRKLGTAPVHAKAALSVEELGQLLAVCGEGAQGARDRAVLLLGFASGLRRSELAGLDLRDIEVLPAGVVLQLRRSKTDQSGAGREIGIHRGEREGTCPVRALEGWLVERGAWAGALFCRVSVAGAIVRGRRISGVIVAKIVQAAAERAGLDRRRYGGHSLRAGLATAAAGRGASAIAIMRRTGHRSTGMVERYIRHGSLFAVDPLAGLL